MSRFEPYPVCGTGDEQWSAETGGMPESVMETRPLFGSSVNATLGSVSESSPTMTENLLNSASTAAVVAAVVVVEVSWSLWP